MEAESSSVDMETELDGGEEVYDVGYGRKVTRSSANFKVGGFGIQNDGDDEKKKPKKGNAEIDEANKKAASVVAAKEREEQDNNYNFFYKNGDTLTRWGTEHINDNGADDDTIVINAHGSPDGIASPEGWMNAKQLHQYLLKYNELYQASMKTGKEITVRLESCNSGNCTSGTSIAKTLSSYNPNMTVIGNTTKSVSVAGIFSYLKDGGEHVAFKGGKKIEE